MQHAFVKHTVHVVELKEFLYFNMISAWPVETPLSVAASKEDSRVMITTLMAGGAQLDYRTREGLTPLHKAAVCGQANSVKVTYLKMQIEYNKSSALNKALGDFWSVARFSFQFALDNACESQWEFSTKSGVT